MAASGHLQAAISAIQQFRLSSTTDEPATSRALPLVANVRDGSIPDLCRCNGDVRFTPFAGEPVAFYSSGSPKKGAVRTVTISCFARLASKFFPKSFSL